MGSASYAPENDALCWKIRSFPGGKVFYISFASLSMLPYLMHEWQMIREANFLDLNLENLGIYVKGRVSPAFNYI